MAFLCTQENGVAGLRISRLTNNEFPLQRHTIVPDIYLLNEWLLLMMNPA